MTRIGVCIARYTFFIESNQIYLHHVSTLNIFKIRVWAVFTLCFFRLLFFSCVCLTSIFYFYLISSEIHWKMKSFAALNLSSAHYLCCRFNFFLGCVCGDISMKWMTNSIETKCQNNTFLMWCQIKKAKKTTWSKSNETFVVILSIFLVKFSFFLLTKKFLLRSVYLPCVVLWFSLFSPVAFVSMLPLERLFNWPMNIWPFQFIRCDIGLCESVVCCWPFYCHTFNPCIMCDCDIDDILWFTIRMNRDKQ